MADSEAAPEKAISDVKELMDRLEKLGDGDFIYRGQANANWRLKSGAVRRVQGKEKADSDDYPFPDDVQDYILELVDNAKSLGLEFHGGTRDHCCALKVLAELQHHGAATNLLDFSRNVLVALWMACSEEFDQDGKIFFANLEKEEENEDVETLGVAEAGTITIPKLFQKSKIQVWTPERFDGRIQSQSSVFLIAPNESWIKFDSILVDKACKKKLLNTLEKRFGLTEVQVYPDLPGFAKANRTQMPYSPRQARFYVREAERAVESGDLESARRLFEKAAKVGPENAYVFFKRGYFRDEHDDPVGAVEDYGTVIKLNPDSVSAYNNRGILRKSQGDPVGAMDDYNTAIKLNPDDADVYNNRGNLKKDQGDTAGAMADYDMAIKRNPDFAAAYNNRGNLRKDQGDTAGAMADYDMAIKRNPDHVGAYFNKALLLEKMGKIPEAIACCQTFIRLKPDDPDGPKLLAILEKKLKK